MNQRDAELTARHILATPGALGEALVARRWDDIVALLEFVQRDVPPDLAMTDPALYRQLRDQITRFHLRGGSVLSLEKVRALAAAK